MLDRDDQPAAEDQQAERTDHSEDPPVLSDCAFEELLGVPPTPRIGDVKGVGVLPRQAAPVRCHRKANARECRSTNDADQDRRNH